MRFRHFALLILVACTAPPAARGADPLNDVATLRGRNEFESALKALDRLERDPDLTAEVRQVLPLERAQTLAEQAARGGQRAADAKQQRERAATLFDQFARSQPQHPKSVEALSAAGQLFLETARTELSETRQEEDRARRTASQKLARERVGRARRALESAHERIAGDFRTYPVYIDREEEPERYRSRGVLELAYIRVQLDLATCRYEEARTWDEGSAEFRAEMAQAAEVFVKIHERYRAQVGGLYARLWQGRCYQELGDVRKALGIFEELLGHRGSSPTLREIQNQTLQHRLACLNDEKRKDYVLSLIEAEAWLAKADETERLSAPGLGIRWERARAARAHADDPEIAPAEREQLLRQAQKDVEFLLEQHWEYSAEARNLAAAISKALEI